MAINNTVDLKRIPYDKLEILGEFHNDLSVFEIKRALTKEKLRKIKRMIKGGSDSEIIEANKRRANELKNNIKTLNSLIV